MFHEAMSGHARSKAPAAAAFEDLLGYNLRRASAAMMAHFNQSLSAIPLTAQQFAILSLVAEHPGTPQSELCRQLAVKKTNMAPLVAELEGRGLIERAPSSVDRRIHLLRLTPTAASQLPDWQARVQRHEDAFFGPLSQARRDELRKMLQILWKEGPLPGRD